MTAAGFDSQVGYAVESPSGTYTAPTRAIEHVKSSLNSKRPDIVSKGIKAGRRHQGRRSKGLEVVAGTITHELSPINTGMLFKQGMGAVSTSGAGPYTHVFTPGALVETQTLTVQVGTPSENGTVNPFNFTGCQINGFTITSKTGEVVMIDLDFIGQHMQNTGDGDSVSALVAATYSSTWAPFTCLHGVLSVNGSAYEFDDCTIKVANNLKTGRYTHRSTTPSQAKVAKESGWRDFTAVVNSDFWDLTAMARSFAGTEVAFSLVFTNGANTLTIAGNVRTAVDTPVVTGPDNVKQGLAFDFVSLTSDAAAFTATLVNTDTLP